MCPPCQCRAWYQHDLDGLLSSTEKSELPTGWSGQVRYEANPSLVVPARLDTTCLYLDQPHLDPTYFSTPTLEHGATTSTVPCTECPKKQKTFGEGCRFRRRGRRHGESVSQVILQPPTQHTDRKRRQMIALSQLLKKPKNDDKDAQHFRTQVMADQKSMQARLEQRVRLA
jgi:hypothetical protein